MKRIAKKRVSLRKLLMEYYAALYDTFGHRNWWPADSPFEVCVGAILTQNTAWENVAKAINNLKQASALDPFVIYRMPVEELAQLIRPAGYYNVKAVRLRNFISLIVEKHGGDLSSLFSVPLESLREELLSINGIGKETADSITLYAAGKSVFVVDAYTKRVLERHKIIAEKADYDTIQRLFHAHLPRDVALFNDFHAQIVAVGHNYCKRRPLCEICPLRGFLPGPVFGPF